MQLISKIALVALLGLTLSGCSSALIEPERIDIKDPGPKTKVFQAPFMNVWRSCLLVLGKYPLRSYDEDAGVIETDYVKGEDVWIAPHRKKHVPGGLRYKLNLRVIKGKAGSKSATKVIVIKQTELQKDFFSNTKKQESDGLEELALLYRIERELALNEALSNVDRQN